MKKILAVGAAASLMLVSAACGGDDSSSGSGDAVKIGVVISLSGPVSAFGLLTKSGIDLAVKDVNAKGGVNGKPLEVKYFDDTSRPERAVALAQQVIQDKSIVAVIGGTAAATGPALVPVLDKGGVPTITLFGDPSKTTAPMEHVFHTAAAYDQHAEAILAYVRDQAKKTRLGVEFQTNDYGQTVSKAISAKASSYGIQVVASEGLDPNTTDAGPTVRKILAANPDAMVSVNTTNLAPVISAWKSSGSSVPLVQTIAASVSANLAAADQASIGLPVLAYFNGQVPLARQKAVADAYQKQYGKPAQYNVATGWDALHLMAQATSGDKPTRDSVTAALNKVNKYEGAAGIITFSPQSHEGFDDSGWIWLTYEGGASYKLNEAWATANNVKVS
jgi:branched-chain amino acid transport system substrate-binding protein